ncbi:MAG TPA: TPM domain-containing protein [Candidatus Goldiibacteriota bacterium]|nr:TPM domain-containing protein [Candidatus Goldiibacteriota bacterium]
MKREFYMDEREKAMVEAAISAVESRTSGKIRVLVAKKGGRDVMLSARAAFMRMGLSDSAEKNAILFFIGVKDRKFAVLGDDGINEKVPGGFWEKIRDAALARFSEGLFAEGLTGAINLAGEKMADFFPGENTDAGGGYVQYE